MAVFGTWPQWARAESEAVSLPSTFAAGTDAAPLRWTPFACLWRELAGLPVHLRRFAATVDNLCVACQPSTFALRATVDTLHLACQPKLAPCDSASERRLVAQIFPRWNPLTSWMRQIEDFQRAA
jgi:hypothetical protein